MTRIFISHSHSDKRIAFKLVSFILAALRLEEEKDIVCTSNPDTGLEYSFLTITDQLKNQLKNSSALIILITADSLHSAWIPFEAGSFWTTDKTIIPILGPGLTQNDLPGPLKNLLSIAIDTQDSKDRLNNAIRRLADKLNIQQKVTTRRNDTLQEFSDYLKAWQSKRPDPDTSQQAEIERLLEEKEELEQQLAELRSLITQQQSNLQSAQAKIAEQKTIIDLLNKQLEQLQSEPITTAEDKVELKSAKGIDYTQLRDLLAAGEWKEADMETTNVMLKVANRESEGWLRESDINNFPCEDLDTINQLWLHYSEGKFGFTVQKEIYKSLEEAIKSNIEIWDSFCDRIGWEEGNTGVNYDDLTFSSQAPRGHLPTPPTIVASNFELSDWVLQVIYYYTCLFYRAKTCNL